MAHLNYLHELASLQLQVDPLSRQFEEVSARVGTPVDVPMAFQLSKTLYAVLRIAYAATVNAFSLETRISKDEVVTERERTELNRRLGALWHMLDSLNYEQSWRLANELREKASAHPGQVVDAVVQETTAAQATAMALKQQAEAARNERANLAQAQALLQLSRTGRAAAPGAMKAEGGAASAAPSMQHAPMGVAGRTAATAFPAGALPLAGHGTALHGAGQHQTIYSIGPSATAAGHHMYSGPGTAAAAPAPAPAPAPDPAPTPLARPLPAVGREIPAPERSARDARVGLADQNIANLFTRHLSTLTADGSLQHALRKMAMHLANDLILRADHIAQRRVGKARAAQAETGAGAVAAAGGAGAGAGAGTAREDVTQEDMEQAFESLYGAPCPLVPDPRGVAAARPPKPSGSHRTRVATKRAADRMPGQEAPRTRRSRR